jgi:hypothetical protein
MMRPTDVPNDEALKNSIRNEIPVLRAAMADPEFWADPAAQLTAVFAVRRWVVALCNYSGRELLLEQVPRGEVASVTRRLARHEIGVWCAGASTYFTEVLRLLGFPAGNLVYGYGGDMHHLGHTTTLVGIQDRTDSTDWEYNFYNIDAYLCYHFTEAGGDLGSPPLAITEMLERIKQNRHDTIAVVDERIERDLITPPGHDPAVRPWLFDGEMPASTTLPNGVIVTPGATHSIDKLFPDGSPMWKLAQQVIGGRSFHEWALDWILVNPWLEEMGPPCTNQTSKCLANVTLTRKFLGAAMGGNK